jgi:linoleoyl-CoA desaturase
MCALLFGFTKVLIAFNIAHDASHDALFKSRRLNHLFSYSFNLIGVNRYIWNIKHNVSHHAFTNIPGYDMDIEQVRIARLADHVPPKWYYRYQHIYVPLLYPFTSLYMIFIKDFRMFATKQYGTDTFEKHPRREYVILFISKLFYITYALIIPLLVIDLPAGKILWGFVLMHLVLGTFLALILFPVHALDEKPFPEPDANGLIDTNWISHQVLVTSNFAANNGLLTWLSGGLNIHIPHHIFPGICHIHYPALSRIIKRTAREHGMAYEENTLYEAVCSHLRLLKKMGTGQNSNP